MSGRKEIAMRCPYCAQEMDVGLIHSPHEIAWLKGAKRKLFARAFLHQDSIILSRLSIWKGSAVTAHRCAACKKILIDYADEQSDRNNG